LRSRFSPLCLIVAAIVLSQEALAATFPEASFSAATVEFGEIRLADVRGQLQTGGDFNLSVQNLKLSSSTPEIEDMAIAGTILESPLQGDGTVVRGDVFVGAYTAGFEYTWQAEEVSAVLRLADQELLALKALAELPPQADWIKRGVLDAHFRYTEKSNASAQLELRLAITDLGFDSPDGRFAAEAISTTVHFSAPLDRWPAPEVNGTISSGELLLDDFYRNFEQGEFEFALKPTWNDNGLEIHSFSLTDRSSLTVAGRAGLEFSDSEESWQLEISQLELEFPGAYDDYLEPMLAAWTLDGLGMSGRLSWSGEWKDGQFRSGDLGITDLSIVDLRQSRFAVTGLEVRMRPGDYSFNSRLSWRGLLLGRINLGAGELALDAEPGKFAIVQPLDLGVLGGRVVLNELSVLLPGSAQNENGDPDIRLRMDIENLDMEQLTTALEWPLFSGKISGHIPGVSVRDGILEVEGEIKVNVFDGMLSLGDLRVERPFGVLPSLAASIEVTHLDLEQLTRTFSFGQISGRVDGYVRDLRMLDWKPVAFDAWLGTTPSQKGSRDISRKAVNQLTTLGGGGATTALTGPVMKLFNNFSYTSLGLGCRMQNNVCEIRGVSEDDVSVLIMEGAGVPKITIRAFNRRVDWPTLLAQLVAASEGDSIKIGD